MAKIDQTILVYDYGHFSWIAETLAAQFTKVYLYIPWESSFPQGIRYIVGLGLENVEKIPNIWDVFDEIDIFFFTDLLNGSFQGWLRDQDKAVFGAGIAERMELERDFTNDILKKNGLNVPDTKKIIGYSNLVDYLNNHKDKYIKTNIFRGDNETWHHENIDLSEPKLEQIRRNMSITKESQTFIVTDPIENVCEIGYDGFNVLGKYPDLTVFGMEVKGNGYVCVRTDYDDLPAIVRTINRKLSSYYRQSKYMGWYSNEIRASSDEDGYLIDQTMRLGEPPSALVTNMITNFGECVSDVSRGTLPEVSIPKKYGVQINLTAGSPGEEPTAIFFPKQYKSQIKIRNGYFDGNKYYIIPPDPKSFPTFSIVSTSDNLKQCMQEVMDIAGQVKGYDIEYSKDICDNLNKAIEEINKKGIKNNF